MPDLRILVALHALGILTADRIAPPPEPLLAAGLLLLLLALRARRARLRSALTLAVAFLAGAQALAWQLATADRSHPDPELEAAVVATVERVSRFSGWYRLELSRARSVDPPDARVPARILVEAANTPEGLPALERAVPGDRVLARLRLRAPRDRHNPGARPRARRLARAGVGAVARPVHPLLHARFPDEEGWRLLAPLHRLRSRAAERLRARGEGGVLLAALGLGDRAGLVPETRDAFARLGIAHLLAVSGLHLALVAALAYALARSSLVRFEALTSRRDVRPLALILATACACLQALLAGWGVPVRRALVFLVAWAISVARARPGRRTQPLALAALAILVFEPHALFEAGAQLSFAASAALVLAAGPVSQAVSQPRRDPLRRLETLVRTTATATLATAPLAAFHLGVVAPLALVANLVAVPWTGLVLLPLALVCAVASGLAPPAILDPLLTVGATLAELSVGAVEAVGDRVPAVAASPAPPWLWWIAVGIVSLGALAARRTSLRVAGSGLVVLLLGLAPAPEIVPRPPRIVFLDVGQGDAVIVQGERGVVLVDGGGAVPGRFDLGRSTVVPALAALGIARIDLLIATHADLDHRGGVPAVVARVPVGQVWLPRGGRSEPQFGEIAAAARRAGVPVLERGAGHATESFGDVRVTPLWPPAGLAAPTRNDASLVVRVEVAGRRVLLPGDVGVAAEAGLVARGTGLRSQVLLLAHHGSRTSSSRALLRAVDPEVTVASAPCRGRFGMPHPEVVARIREARLPLWRTGRDGAVIVGLGDPLVVRGFGPAGAHCEEAAGLPRRSEQVNPSARPRGGLPCTLRPPADRDTSRMPPSSLRR